MASPSAALQRCFDYASAASQQALRRCLDKTVVLLQQAETAPAAAPLRMGELTLVDDEQVARPAAAVAG